MVFFIDFSMKFPDYSNMRSTTLLITRMKSGANKKRKNLVDELKGHEEARNKTARLREKYEEIQAAIEQNYSHKLIAAALEKQGLKFPSQRSFETTWHRIKSEKRKQMEGTTKPITTTQAPAPVAAPVTTPNEAPVAVAPATGSRRPQIFRPATGILSELKPKGEQN